LQPIYNIAEICSQHGIKHAILSPGSRCAPLTISFARHPDITCKVIPDERSAAFIAMGMALQSQTPVVLICTSGSAALNYFPAIAEAYYQHIPLIVLTADRPAEWIDQQDGQTIRQNQVYGSHCKASFTFPVDYQHPDAVWQTERIISEAIIEAKQYPKGPVHINIPMREPLYPTEPIIYDKNIRIFEAINSNRVLGKETILQLEEILKTSSRILLVAGQQSFASSGFTHTLKNFVERFGAVLISEPLGNISNEIDKINSQDLLIGDFTEEEKILYQPDLLITFGGAIISKSLKGYLRKYKAKKHWHIQPTGSVADTFQSINKIINLTAEEFFHSFKKDTSTKSDYQKNWLKKEKTYRKLKDTFFAESQIFAEIQAINQVINQLPDHSILHISNSMPIRYGNFAGINNSTIGVFCNRGTSGIDGVISTAYGAALSSNAIVTVLTGDMAFFYDRNAFWNNYLPKNLRIILINNSGGGIFRMIDGPSSQPELEEYFATSQKLNARSLANEFGMKYLESYDSVSLSKNLKNLYQDSEKPSVLEIFTNPVLDKEELKKFKRIAFQ
jgi:2-succinyl-5-enolpyruvyl-6-hydroxy-3-cyclohexene-1-carboxylate synthase